jgi:hypothetical protein
MIIISVAEFDSGVKEVAEMMYNFETGKDGINIINMSPYTDEGYEMEVVITPTVGYIYITDFSDSFVSMFVNRLKNEIDLYEFKHLKTAKITKSEQFGIEYEKRCVIEITNIVGPCDSHLMTVGYLHETLPARMLFVESTSNYLNFFGSSINAAFTWIIRSAVSKLQHVTYIDSIKTYNELHTSILFDNLGIVKCGNKEKIQSISMKNFDWAESKLFESIQVPLIITIHVSDENIITGVKLQHKPNHTNTCSICNLTIYDKKFYLPSPELFDEIERMFPEFNIDDKICLGCDEYIIRGIFLFILIDENQNIVDEKLITLSHDIDRLFTGKQLKIIKNVDEDDEKSDCDSDCDCKCENNVYVISDIIAIYSERVKSLELVDRKIILKNPSLMKKNIPYLFGHEVVLVSD